MDSGVVGITTPKPVAKALNKPRPIVGVHLHQLEVFDALKVRSVPREQRHIVRQSNTSDQTVAHPDTEHVDYFHSEPGDRLDYALADTSIRVEHDHLRLDDYYLTAATVKLTPTNPRPAAIASALSRVNCDFIACMEWKTQSMMRMRKLIKPRQKTFIAQGVSMFMAAFAGAWTPKSEMPRKQDLEHHAENLGDCLVALEQGNQFGAYSCVVVLIGKDHHRVHVENVTRFECRNAGKQVTIRDLVKVALRHRPDHLVIGEIRGAEAMDLLDALNTGNSGSLTTIHANSALSALTKLSNLALRAGADVPYQAVQAQIADVIHYVVHMQRKTNKRYVAELVQLHSYDFGNNTFQFERVFERSQHHD